MLKKLKEALAASTAELETLTAKAFGDDGTEEDLQLVDGKSKELDALLAKIKIAEAAEKHIAAGAKPVDGGQERGADMAGTVPARPLEKMSTELRLGLAIKSMISAREYGGSVAKALEENGYGAVVKELVTTTDSKGGVTIPENLSNDVIEMLRPQSAFLAGNPQRIVLQNGNLTIPRAETGVSGGYTAEATDIPVEEPTLGSMSLSAKKLAVIVPISNELLTWSPVDMEAFIRRDITAGLTQKMDLNLLRGDGSGGNPLGIVNTVGIETFAATAAGATTAETIQNIEADLAAAETFMALANLPMQNRAWVMSPRTLIYLSSLRDGNGNRVWPELNGDSPRLRNKRVLTTTQVPVNLGVGTNESEIYLIEYSEVWFAETPGGGLSFAVSQEASYKVGGVMYSAYQRDVTLIRGIMHHDTDIRRLSAVVKITAVTWGA